jgi:DNA-directed RNA polymerase subunit RPC12/RpoP
MAEAATVIAFDPRAAQYDGAVTHATRTLGFYQPRPGVMRVQPQAFQAMASAVFAQQDYHDHVYQQRGIYDLHPDRASRDLQRRVGFSLFVQGWLPMLEEAQAKDLILRTGLGAEYIEAEPPTGDKAGCACCGAPMTVLAGARVVVCEKCGHRLEVGGARLSCKGCGAPLAPPEGKPRFNCPHCKVEVQRVA